MDARPAHPAACSMARPPKHRMRKPVAVTPTRRSLGLSMGVSHRPVRSGVRVRWGGRLLSEGIAALIDRSHQATAGGQMGTRPLKEGRWVMRVAGARRLSRSTEGPTGGRMDVSPSTSRQSCGMSRGTSKADGLSGGSDGRSVGNARVFDPRDRRIAGRPFVPAGSPAGGRQVPAASLISTARSALETAPGTTVEPTTRAGVPRKPSACASVASRASAASHSALSESLTASIFLTGKLPPDDPSMSKLPYPLPPHRPGVMT